MRLVSLIVLALVGAHPPPLHAVESAPTVIDLLVVTSQELGAERPIEEIRALAASRVAWGNAAFERSGIAAELRLVGCTTSDVRASSSVRTAYDNVLSDSGVASLRRRLGADFVSVWMRGGNGVGGLGGQPGAFTALDLSFADHHTMTHEIGHNLGASHGAGVGASIMSQYNGGSNGYFSAANAATIRRNLASAAARMPSVAHPQVAVQVPERVVAGERVVLPLQHAGPVAQIAAVDLQVDRGTTSLGVDAREAVWIPMQGGEQRVAVRVTTTDGGEFFNTYTVQVDERPSVLGPWRRSMLGGDFDLSAFELPGEYGLRLNARVRLYNVSAWSDSDHAHFIYVPVTGDCEITAYQSEGGNDSGLMIRPDVMADSPRVSFGWWSSAATLARRDTRRATSAFMKMRFIDGTGGVWWRLRREGTTYTASFRYSGGEWQELGSTELNLPNDILVGVFASDGYPDEWTGFYGIEVTDLHGELLYRGPGISPSGRRVRAQASRSADWSCWAASGTFPVAESLGSWSALYPADTHILRADDLPAGDG